MMEIRIGIVNAPREVAIELPEDATIDDVKATIDAGVTDSSGLVWLTDRKGKQSGFPADKIAYVEIGDSDDQRIGFS